MVHRVAPSNASSLTRAFWALALSRMPSMLVRAFVASLTPIRPSAGIDEMPPSNRAGS